VHTSLNKEQVKQITEKAAIIANQAFILGREAESQKIVDYCKQQICLLYQDMETCEHERCYFYGDVIAYIRGLGAHKKNEIRLGANNGTTN